MIRFVLIAATAISIFVAGCSWQSDTEIYQTKGVGRCCAVSSSTSSGSASSGETLPICKPDETPICPDSGVGGKQ